MTNWIHLFEKYRIDRRLLDIYRGEWESLMEHSPRRASLQEAIDRVEGNIHAAERLLAHYGDKVSDPREAIRRADERLFLAYRYIHGLTMEATAVEMCVSRDTVYRIRRRILARGDVPAEYLARFCQNSDYAVSEDGNLGDTRLRVSDPEEILPAVEPAGDDVCDVLAACFAGAPSGVPSAMRSFRH